MAESGSNYAELAYASIKVFADDGTLDMGELNFLIGIALKDGKIDQQEIQVLKRIFSKIIRSDVSPRVWQRIQAVKQKLSIE